MVSKGSSDGVFNSLPWERLEVTQTQDGAGKPRLGMLNITYRFAKYCVSNVIPVSRICGVCGPAALVRAPSVGFCSVKDTQPATPVSITVQVCTNTWISADPDIGRPQSWSGLATWSKITRDADHTQSRSGARPNCCSGVYTVTITGVYLLPLFFFRYQVVWYQVVSLGRCEMIKFG